MTAYGTAHAVKTVAGRVWVLHLSLGRVSVTQVSGPGGENYKGTLMLSGATDLGHTEQGCNSIYKILPGFHVHSGMEATETPME